MVILMGIGRQYFVQDIVAHIHLAGNNHIVGH